MRSFSSEIAMFVMGMIQYVYNVIVCIIPFIIIVKRGKKEAPVYSPFVCVCVCLFHYLDVLLSFDLIDSTEDSVLKSRRPYVKQ